MIPGEFEQELILMKSSRITQLLLAALVIMQVPNLIDFVQGLRRYESPEAALRACQQWAENAGTFTVKRTGLWTSYSLSPARSCSKEGDHYVGYEIPLDGATEISNRPNDPIGFNFNNIPEVEDTGNRWSFRRKKWSIVIPF